jgi:hypothetical protein
MKTEVQEAVEIEGSIPEGVLYRLRTGSSQLYRKISPTVTVPCDSQGQQTGTAEPVHPHDTVQRVQPSPATDSKPYFIGQRVLVDNEIVTTIHPPGGGRKNSETVQWVCFPNGLTQWRATDNLKPLPNGQL